MGRFWRDPYVAGYLGVYALVLAVGRLLEGFPLFLPLFVLVVMAGILPAVAFVATRGFDPTPGPVRRPARESLLLAVYLTVGVGLFLSVGMERIRASVTGDATLELVVLGAKLVVFVAGPVLLVAWPGQYRLGELANTGFGWRRHGRTVLIMLLFILPYQALIGQGVGELREAGFGVWQLAAGGAFAFGWLMVEVGLVEEIPYRILLQSRLAAFLRSESGAVVGMALLFGLAHAPGLYLRGSSEIAALGPSPSPVAALTYSIVVTSPAGIFLGVLWARTRSLWVVLLVHAGFDWLPQVTDLTRTFIAP